MVDCGNPSHRPEWPFPPGEFRSPNRFLLELDDWAAYAAEVYLYDVLIGGRHKTDASHWLQKIAEAHDLIKKEAEDVVQCRLVAAWHSAEAVYLQTQQKDLGLDRIVVEQDERRREYSTADLPSASEEALALSFSAAHANDLRYVASWGKWMFYDGRRWAPDDSGTLTLGCWGLRTAELI
jgi:hypothetical protein